jgi:hypothetical protein
MLVAGHATLSIAIWSGLLSEQIATSGSPRTHIAEVIKRLLSMYRFTLFLIDGEKYFGLSNNGEQ